MFNTDMVIANLEGRKTMTRRIIKPQPDDSGLHNHTRYPMSLNSTMDGWWGVTEETGEDKKFKCPYGEPGDLLWARETWMYNDDTNIPYAFKADAVLDYTIEYQERMKGLWKPSIHMPKEAARLWMRVARVFVERLYDISATDAANEGVNRWNEDFVSEPGAVQADYENYMWRDDPNYEDYNFPSYANPVSSFFSLWEKINGKESLLSNPWVWAIEYEILSTTGKPKNI